MADDTRAAEAADEEATGTHTSLTLGRKEGELIDIGSGLVQVTIQRISGNRVSVRVNAPRELRIVRGEHLPPPPLTAVGA